MAEALQNRWYHRPELHEPGHDEERKVGWLELFYDLIFVAAFIQLGNALSEHVSIPGFLGFFGVMAAIWFQWTGFTFYSNRFVVDDVLHRSMVFVQMAFIGGVAVSVPYVFDGQAHDFALAYAGARVTLVAFYLRTWLQTEDARDLTMRYAIGFSIAALLWLASAFIPTPWTFGIWALAMSIDLSLLLSRRARELVTRKYPPDVHHMAERYGLLTIIVLGESFVKVLTAVAADGLSLPTAGMGVVALGVTCFLWWLYFDDIVGSRIRPTKWSPVIWVYAHLPFTAAVVAVGVAIKKAVFFPPFDVAPVKYRVLLCGTVALALVSASILDAVTTRRQSDVGDELRVAIRLGAGFFVLLLIPIGAGISSWLFVLIVFAVCSLQVVADLLTAPLAADPESIHDGAAFGTVERSERPKGPADRAQPRYRDIGEAVRKGTPSELRRDLYFHLMEGSWTQLLGAMVVLYLVTNAAFAALYLLEPGGVGIAGVDANDFWGAFAFSVQTMSTIGYGTLSPQSGYADFLVTVEAAVGLLGVAVATGVIFAKIARPKASVLFSDPIVVTPMAGERTMMFRVGNARGNEVVEASVHVSALIDEVTDEGLRFRRVQDLQLVRDNSPIFALSWTIMHRLDASSPLHGLDADEVYDRLVAIIVTMTGFDGTYMQTTHARYIYRPEDFEFDRRFVDVIETLDDGRLVIDYDKFHLTEPDEPSDDRPRPETGDVASIPAHEEE